MDLSCGGIPPERQALETPGHYIPDTPEKSATTKRTLISVFNGQGSPALESLVDVPVALLIPLAGKSVSSTGNQIITSPVASITPGNDKSVQHCNPKEDVPLVTEYLNNKRGPKEFHMLQTGATGKRIDLCSDNVFSNPVAPLTPYKDKTAKNCQSAENAELADKRLIVGNIQENCMNKKIPSLDANSSLGGLSPRYMENERDEDEETQGIDLNKTPRKKLMKRKRHRPKVIQESKSIKSLKPISPKTDENKGKLTPKRTYVRKKQRLSSSKCLSAAIEKKKEIPIPIRTYVRKRKTPSSSASGMNLCNSSPTELKNVDQFSRKTTKSVRRSLDFSLEGETRDDINVSTENDIKFVALKPFNGSSAGCSREFTVELTQGPEVSATESSVGIAFDLNRSLNQVLEEYIQLPENPTLSAQSHRRETVKEHLKDFNSTKDVDSDMYMQSCQEKFDAGSHLDIILIDNDIDKIGTKRDYEHIDVSKDCSAKESQQDISLAHDCNGNKQNRFCQETSSLSLYWPVIFKKRRQERRQISGYNRALITPFARLLHSELKLLFHPSQRQTGKRSKVPARVCKRIPKAGAEDCSHLLGSEKTKGSLSQENKNHEPQSCVDALFADARFRTTTKKRRKRRYFHLVSSTLSNMKQEYEVIPEKFSFLGQPLVRGLSASQWKNLHQIPVCYIQDCHRRSSMQRSFYSNFQPQVVVPYMNPVEFIVERIKHMKISEVQIQPIGEGKHALIPYGGGSLLVPYKRFFDIVKKKRPRAKVDLDSETNRVWNLLMWKTSGDEGDGVDMDKEKWWKKEREVFRGRADAFIARMRLILGDRSFSEWKGSVVDSVVGVFLTQNVSDHLSSSAFMSLAARFPLQRRGKRKEANVENMNTSEEHGDGNIPAGSDEQSIEVQPEERNTAFPVENTDKEVEILVETQHCGAQAEYLSSCNYLEEKLENLNAVQFDIENKVCNSQNVQPERGKSTPRTKKVNGDESEKKMFDWDGLRRDAFLNGAMNERSSDTLDSLDWEAVRTADVTEISQAIRERGMNNVLAQRIQDFLNRLVTDHGGIDLEWLRNVPPEKAKDYLLSIRGLGIKSVECVRLLTLHHLAFPVDTNVGRIAVRLGWVPLQPLPESLQLHLLELYPMIEHIQKYLWPRLCTLDQHTLYELHYHMITFGKVFCTKARPNCNACPMRGECKHFASAFASAKLALPGPEEKGLATSKLPPINENDLSRNFRSLPLPQLDDNKYAKGSVSDDCQPIIEEPTTPEHECTEALEVAIEDAFYEDHEDIPTIKLSSEEFKKNLKNYMQENIMEIQDEDMSKALVAITVEAASIPMLKLKNVSRLRTEHLVYELTDSHPLLEGMDCRVPDDPSPYLLAIWTPGETAQSIEPPQSCCNSPDSSKLCDRKTCFACNTVRESMSQIVRGTILIPCRTAMKGSFPLNGTYFQVNEVFADHTSSRTPIDVPREWIWNLRRRTVFFGTSVPTIFRGLTMEGIQRCFWRGFVCVRGFDRITRAPKPLYARLHFPPSKAVQNNKTPAKEEK